MRHSRPPHSTWRRSFSRHRRASARAERRPLFKLFQPPPYVMAGRDIPVAVDTKPRCLLVPRLWPSQPSSADEPPRSFRT